MPALAPKTQNIADLIEKAEIKKKAGGKVEFPLKIPEGFYVGIFAKNLSSPRDLQLTPGGTMLVSVPKNGKVEALPDVDHDGVADQIKTILSGLDNPHGMAFYNNQLFVAEETAVTRYDWDENNLEATIDKLIVTLPDGGRHTTRTLEFDPDGRLYVSIGSTCDVCHEIDPWIATVLTTDYDGRNPRVFAKGLRNAVFIKMQPITNLLWGTEMGRDFLGDNLPSDEINILREGKDYGWPICYGNKIHDTSFDKNQYIVNPCDATENPVFEIAAHSAPLGLAFIDSPIFPTDWQGDLLVSLHGSWNRSTPVGYKVVRLSVDGEKVSGEEDFLTGFLSGRNALGRPVDLEFDSNGYLYISDDKAGVVYIVSR